MKVFQKELKGTNTSFLPMFVTSAVVVWIFIMIQGSDLLLQTEVLEESTLSLMKYRAQDCRSLLLYVLKERCLVIPIIFLLSTTYLAAWAVYGALLWYGAASGAVLGVAVLRYGIRGIFLVLAAGIPQYLFYVPAMVMALRLSVRQRTPNRKFFVQFLILEVVVIIGCILESYVNLMVVEKIIKIFITG